MRLKWGINFKKKFRGAVIVYCILYTIYVKEKARNQRVADQCPRVRKSGTRYGQTVLLFLTNIL
jgi:hypothetical protein